MKKLFILISSIYLSSCAFHNGNISSSSFSKNVVYEDRAFGVSMTKKIFGIGGLNHDALILEAKNEMMNSRPLKANEQYANLAYDIKNTYVLMVLTTKVTISADVVKLVDGEQPYVYSETYKSKISKQKFQNDLFNIGDSVMFDDLKSRGTILSISTKGKVRVKLKDSTNKFKTKNIDIHKLFSLQNNYKGLNINQDYSYKQYDLPREVKVLAFGLDQILVKELKIEEEKIFLIKYKRLEK
jgi:hypothetical protein